MPVYVALIRGINLGRHKRIKMEALRRSFAALGFEDVKTYVQSGNVIFKTAKQGPSGLAAKIENRILRDFGFDVSVVVRTSEDMGRAIRRNPFLRKKGIAVSKLHVTYLSEVPTRAALQELAALSCQPDQFRCADKEIYLYCPNGFGRSKLSIPTFEKLLSVRATTRNWNSANKIYEMSLT